MLPAEGMVTGLESSARVHEDSQSCCHTVLLTNENLHSGNDELSTVMSWVVEVKAKMLNSGDEQSELGAMYGIEGEK